MTVPGLRKGGGGSAGAALGDRGPPSPSEPASQPLRPALNSRGAVVRGGTRGSARTHTRCSKHGGGAFGVVGSPLRLQARTARAPLALGPSAEGSRAHAGGGIMAGGVGVARAGAEAGAPAKRRRVGPKVAQETGSSAPNLADLARLAARSGGLVRPPPVTL